MYSYTHLGHLAEAFTQDFYLLSKIRRYTKLSTIFMCQDVQHTISVNIKCQEGQHPISAYEECGGGKGVGYAESG